MGVSYQPATAPLPVRVGASGKRPSVVDFRDLTVLLVAENRFARTFIRSALHPYGIGRVEESADPAKAVALINDIAISLAIIDQEMSLLSGLDFTRMVRRGGEVRNDELPIVIASANGEESSVRAAIDAGANAFVLKPFSSEVLFRRIWMIFNRPLPFIRSATYVGPDRRIRQAAPPDGVEKRFRIRPGG